MAYFDVGLLGQKIRRQETKCLGGRRPLNCSRRGYDHHARSLQLREPEASKSMVYAAIGKKAATPHTLKKAATGGNAPGYIGAEFSDLG